MSSSPAHTLWHDSWGHILRERITKHKKNVYSGAHSRVATLIQPSFQKTLSTKININPQYGENQPLFSSFHPHFSSHQHNRMDLWKPEQLERVTRIGNKLGKIYYETTLPEGYGKPSAEQDSNVVMQWLKVKYINKKYFGSQDEVNVLLEKMKAEEPETSTTTTATKTNRRRARKQPEPASEAPKAATPSPPAAQPAATPGVHACFGVTPATTEPSPLLSSITRGATEAPPGSLLAKLSGGANAPVVVAQPAGGGSLLASLQAAASTPAAPVEEESESSEESSEEEDEEEEDSSESSSAQPTAEVAVAPQPLRKRGESFVNLMQRTTPSHPAGETAAVQSFLCFDSPEPEMSPVSRKKKDDEMFLIGLAENPSSGPTGSCKTKSAVLDMFNVDEVPQGSPLVAGHGPPPIGAMNGAGNPAAEIEAKIQQLKMLQAQLTAQMGQSAVPGGGPGVGGGGGGGGGGHVGNGADPFGGMLGGPPPINTPHPAPSPYHPPGVAMSNAAAGPAFQTKPKPATKDPFAHLLAC